VFFLFLPNRPWRCAMLRIAGAGLAAMALASALAAQNQQAPYDAVGVIEGEAIVVTGPVNMEMVHGQVKTMLRSGSDVRVKSGTARIDLADGGQISIYVPAHFSVLTSGGSLTVALEEGTIHALIERGPALTIYTPQIQAQTMAIGDGPRDVQVGIESPGQMCLRANRGAIRVEQQLTGQTVILPQLGEVQLIDGQIEGLQSGAGHCLCELENAKAAPEDQSPNNHVTSANVPPSALNAAPAAEDEPAREGPIYQVIMPPLVYDAKTKAHTPLDPQMIVLIRRVRVRSSVIFRGRVVGEVAAPVAPTPPTKSTTANAAPPGAGVAVPKPTTTANSSFTDRMRNFVRKLWPR